MTERRVADDTLQQARDAISRHAWQEAFDLLTAVDVSDGLTPEDLENLADAAWWTGRMDECIQARERAHAAYAEAGDNRRAAGAAIRLFKHHSQKLESSVAMGWLSSAVRLLAQEPECPEHGYLSWIYTNVAVGTGDLDGALEHARRTLEIGTRHGDRDLQAIGLFDEGNILVAKGQLAEGMALLDEAMVAAVSGELGPATTGTIYCAMITTCERLADYRRAGEWTDAAQRWCGRQSISGFPGLCRVHRAEILRLRGAWDKAEEEAALARDELQGFNMRATGEAFYQIGEIRLRVGDLAAAEEAFRQAHGLGTDPQPGLSLLRLAQGNTEAAASSIRRALADRPSDRLGRARLLPAQVEIALAAGDLETARSTADEMDSIAGAFGSAALQAGAACARGALALVEGDAGGALQSLRQGLRLWQEVDAPFEAARARVLLAQAYRAEGDEEAAALELEAAKSTFERLGAVPDAQRAESLLAGGRSQPLLPARATRTFMFTDICASTNLLEAIGDEAWEDLLRWHDQTLRSLFVQQGGEEIKHAGDGFFVAFSDATAALGCAAAIQRTLADHRRTQGFAPQVRIGLHTAEATRRGRDYGGKAVHQAARIASLAEAGEVLASEETISAAPGGLSVSEPHAVNLKGFAKPVRVAAVAWR
ncbi:MAG: adenylate/guanylate cyclase domain-containing protein [Dehalococcoidia bacterium]|nr:adenylate/guanylate cyclase domain-containing protein [Dehalococcoidia bacterium]